VFKSVLRRGLPLLVVLVMVAVGLVPAQALAARPSALDCDRVAELADSFLKKHINYSYLNDELRGRVIDAYVKRLDPSKTLFRSDEIKALKARLSSVFHEVRNDDCNTLTSVQADVVKRYERMEQEAKSFLTPDSYVLDESTVLILDPDKRAHPATDEARQELLHRLIHFQVSNYLDSDMNLSEAKERTIHRYELMTKRAKETEPVDIFANYLDAFASALDPHSNYFSPQAVEDFQIQMQLSLIGIGVALSSRDGYSVVEKVIPGSAADAVDVLRPNDKIIAVAQDDEDPVDIIDMDLRDVVSLIRGERGTTVNLTVLRQGDTTERFQVAIVRDKINLEEAAAKLRFEDREIEGEKKKLAIIELPSFYGDSDPRARQSSRDVRRLLVKVKEEKADGLLFDLSRNTGGMLPTSIEIAGYFIRSGGIVAVRDLFSDVQVMRDPDEDIVYDGPMVVLTSRVSASASEIVAGALKDYRRAVVVGDDHTFGKGTVQNFVELPGGLGGLKVTTALFFRPGGASTQHEGVASDIIVPSLFATDDLGEKTQPYSLPSQRIKPFLEPVSPLASDVSTPWRPITQEVVNQLASRSSARVGKSEDFAEIEEQLQKIRERDGVIHLAEMIREREEAQAELELEAKDVEGDPKVVRSEEPEKSAKADKTGKSAKAPKSGMKGSKKPGKKGDGSDTAEAEAEEEPTPQQAEALRILADLIALSNAKTLANEL